MCLGRVSPVLKQTFVTAGISINYLTHGLVVGYTSVLIPALLKESTEITVDEASASWIASIFGISLLLGTLSVPPVMGTYGRKPANIFSAVLMTAGWIIIAFSSSVALLLLARFIQGYSMGFLAIIGTALTGEYTSPRNRGAFLATISLCIMMGILISNAIGTFLSWRMSSLAFGIISFLDLLIIIYSPESPSFLAAREKYDECRRTFHWLRGHEEDDELDKMIKTAMIINRNKIVKNDKSCLDTITKKLNYLILTFSKKEVYKPVLITMHLHALSQWSGGITFFAYANDVVGAVVGKDANLSLIIAGLNIQNVVSVLIGVFIVKKLRRKLILLSAVMLNIFSYLSLTTYVYLKANNVLIYDHSFIGIVLLQIQQFTLSTGALTLSNIIPGEIFPMEHRSICGTVGILFFSINETINIKTAPYLFASIGLHGAYIIYVCIVAYCFAVVWMMLPETKDRILLDIEEEFKGKPLIPNNENIEETNSENESFNVL